MAYSHDLSVGGMFLKASRFLPVNAVIRVHLELPEGGGEVPVIARVAYVRDDKEAAATGKPAGMGIHFLDLGGEAASKIERYIAERIEKATAQDSGPVRKAISVVVVDADAGYRELAADAFRRRGDRVRTAADGLEGLGMCLKDPPDLVVTDVQMPRMDGWQLLRMLRSRPTLAATPVLFLTTLSGDEERLRGYQLGVDDYLPKPYRPEELLARAERVLARTAVLARSGADRKTLRGDLENVTLPSVLAFLEAERKTGVLLVLGDRTTRLWLRDGRPVVIEAEGAPADAAPTELVFQLLDTKTGQFEFAVQDVAREDRIGQSVTSLLLEHARIRDEENR